MNPYRILLLVFFIATVLILTFDVYHERGWTWYVLDLFLVIVFGWILLIDLYYDKREFKPNG